MWSSQAPVAVVYRPRAGTVRGVANRGDLEQKGIIMSKKPATPFSGVSRRNVHNVRTAVEIYEDWKRDYLDGVTEFRTPPNPIYFVINLGPGGGHPRAYVEAVEVAHARAEKWVKKHRTDALDDAAMLRDLRMTNRAAYETLMLRRELAGTHAD